MADKRTIGVVTGSRAEYGIMRSVISKISNDSELDLVLFATGSHLLPEFGDTYKEIEADGFHIDEKVRITSSDDDIGICKSMGKTLIAFSEVLGKFDIDILLILGDRYEIFAVASAAYMLKIPIAHISGGDSTEGALDEALRHSITKMSHLHFVTNEMARKRVIQLGENPDNIFLTGNPSLDEIHSYELMNKQELSNLIGTEFRDKIIIVTYHPETLGLETGNSEIEPLLSALNNFSDVSIIFTGTNADSGGGEIASRIREFSSSNENISMVESLGHIGYMSAVKLADVVVGNSSSGLVEVPSLGTPTVNIGDRQKGRICADSVISVTNNSDNITNAIKEAFTIDCSGVKNPYELPDASGYIVNILKNTDNFSCLLKKKFFDLPYSA